MPLNNEVDRLVRDLSNWGRWGDDDQLGLLNLITVEKRVEAAGCVRTGEVFSLGLEIREDMPQAYGASRRNPRHLMTMTGTDYLASGVEPGGAEDEVTLHTHAATHWDAFAHMFHRGAMYNDRPAAAVTSAGAPFNDIVPAARALATRGVLLDVARALDVDALRRDHEVTISDLEATLEAERVDLTPGDVLVLRTGQLGRARAGSDWSTYTDVGVSMPVEPGIGLECLPWLHECGVVAVAADNWAVEWIPSPDSIDFPVHQVTLVHMGLMLGENFDLDELAAACASDGNYDFLLAAGPLPVSGGTAGPVNPMAIK
jgi:kynurenine formamidase